MSVAPESNPDTDSGAAVEASVEPVSSADQAKAEASAILADTKSPYWDSGHHLHHETVANVTSLFTIAAGDTTAMDEQGQSLEWHDQFEAALEPPETSDVYDFTEVSLAEGEEWDADGEAQARDWLFRAGISESETKSLVGRFNEVRFLDDTARDVMAVETETSLRASWGRNFDANLASARAAVDALGPEFKGFLEESGLANDHGAALTLYRVAKANGL
jgi:hypothetical protein